MGSVVFKEMLLLIQSIVDIAKILAREEYSWGLDPNVNEIVVGGVEGMPNVFCWRCSVLVLGMRSRRGREGAWMWRMRLGHVVQCGGDGE